MPGKKVQPRNGRIDRHGGFQASCGGHGDSHGSAGGQLELNVMMPAMAWNVLHSAEILKNTMRVLANQGVDGNCGHEERCRYYANATIFDCSSL